MKGLWDNCLMHVLTASCLESGVDNWGLRSAYAFSRFNEQSVPEHTSGWIAAGEIVTLVFSSTGSGRSRVWTSLSFSVLLVVVATCPSVRFARGWAIE